MSWAYGLWRGMSETISNFIHGKKQKKRLIKMLSDDRFPKGFRSVEQLRKGIGAGKQQTERLLLQIGARKSENSEEWKLER